MTGINLPDDATKAHMDESTDDPKLARAELADLVDAFNSLKDEIGSDRLQWPIELPNVVYASATSFTTTDTSACHAGRMVQISGSFTGTVYGPITGVSGSTITVSWATLSNETLTAWVDIISANRPASSANYWSVRWSGALGDGTDETTELDNAAAIAKALKLPLWFPYGQTGEYVWSPSSTVDLSGVPSIDGAGVTINTTSATADPVFQVEGSRSAALASGISISEGVDISATVATADIDVGDVLVITSLEAMPNTERSYYYKSGQFVVYANDGAGAIEVRPPIPYSFTTSAYLYRIDLQKCVLGRGLTFRGKTSAAQTAFNLAFSDVDVFSTFTGYNGDICRYITSRGHFEGTVNYTGGTTGGGVDVNDASDVRINGHISSAFHAVDAGGGVAAYWDASLAGGLAENPMALSSRFTVSGGFYASKAFAGTINAHGNVDKAVIGDCLVSGSGVNVSARVNQINNVSIEGTHDILFRWGSDNNSKSWCSVQASNIRIKRYGALAGNFGTVGFNSGDMADEIEIDGLTVEADYTQTGFNESPIVIEGQCNRLVMRNIRPIRGSTTTARGFYADLYADTEYEFENIHTKDGNRVEFNAMAADVNFTMKGIKCPDVTGTSAIRLLNNGVGTNYNIVNAINCEGVNSALHGLEVAKVKTLLVQGGRYADNDGAGGRGINAQTTETLRINGADLSGNGRAFDQTDFGSGSTAAVVGCDVSGNAGDMDGALGTGCTFAARVGNAGDTV